MIAAAGECEGVVWYCAAGPKFGMGDCVLEGAGVRCVEVVVVAVATEVMLCSSLNFFIVFAILLEIYIVAGEPNESGENWRPGCRYFLYVAGEGGRAVTGKIAERNDDNYFVVRGSTCTKMHDLLDDNVIYD